MGFSPLDENYPTIERFKWDDGNSAGDYSYGLDPMPVARRIDKVLCTSTDTVIQKLQFQLVDPANDSVDAFVVSVPIGAGVTTAMVDGLPLLIQGAQGGLILPPGWTIRVGNVATISAGKVVRLLVLGGLR